MQQGIPVTWVLAGGTRVGLVGLDKIPSLLSSVLDRLVKDDRKTPFEVLLFQDRESIDRIFSPFIKKDYSEVQGKAFRPSPSGSRYSFVIDRSTGLVVAALNANALEPNAVGFVVSLLKELLVAIPPDLQQGFDNAAVALIDIFRNYNAKFAIPFVATTPYTSLLARIILENLTYAFAYFSAMNRVVSDGNSRIVADFLEERLEMPFQQIEWEDIDLFNEALGVLWRFIETTNIVQSVSHVPALQQLLRDRNQRNIEKLKTHLGGHEDIIRALDFLAHRLENVDYHSRDKFIESCCEACAEASHLISPNYMRLDEIAELLKVATSHLDAVEGAVISESASPWSRLELMNLLEDIFYKNDVYPEIPVLAGNALLQLLQSLAIAKRDYLAYRRALVVAKRMANLLDRNLAEIRRINRPIGEIRGSPLNEREMILPLLSLAGTARMFNEMDEARNLEGVAKILLVKYDVPELNVLMDWRAFLETHDMDVLQKIYKNFEASGREVDPVTTPFANLIGHLASSFFESSKVEYHLQRAMTIAMELEITADSPASMSMSRNTMLVFVYIVRTFQALFAILTQGAQVDDIRRAKIDSTLLKEELSSLDPANSIAQRTDCLCSLLERDSEGLKRNLISLQKSFVSPQMSNFVKICENWIQQGRLKRRVQKVLESKVDTRDPWNLAALLHLNSELAVQLRTSDLQDYDCIVFVEGPNDRKIFGVWARKIVPKTSILLLPSEGWTNMEYFANARIVDELNKPLFVIFDGDTNRDHVKSIKAKLVTRLKLDPRRIITLKGRSIEDYLLNTRSMKDAFPKIQLKESEIRAFLHSLREKQNKKTVLDLFFKRYLGRKYDGETGERIAAHMTLGEINSEIVDIFTRIGEVAKADQGLTSKFREELRGI